MVKEFSPWYDGNAVLQVLLKPDQYLSYFCDVLVILPILLWIGLLGVPNFGFMTLKITISISSDKSWVTFQPLMVIVMSWMKVQTLDGMDYEGW